MRAYLLALALVLSACGEDEAPPPPPPRPATPGQAAPGQPGQPGQANKGPILKPVTRIEERVVCPVPSDAKKCDPNASICGIGEYCIPAAEEFYCGPCPERDAIRHVFKPRDFQGADLRDPFQSFVITQPGLGTGPGDKVPTEVTPKCTRKDQFVAQSSNYQSLKIIGIVSQGTQRKVLLSDGRIGHIVKKGDCVGKEKAVVKDIGAGYVTFAVEAAGKDDPVEYSMQLYPTQVSLSTPDAIDPGAASAPIVTPPSVPAPAPAPEPETRGTTTTIIQQKPQQQQQQVPPPAQPPVQLKP